MCAALQALQGNKKFLGSNYNEQINWTEKKLKNWASHLSKKSFRTGPWPLLPEVGWVKVFCLQTSEDACHHGYSYSNLYREYTIEIVNHKLSQSHRKMFASDPVWSRTFS